MKEYVVLTKNNLRKVFFEIGDFLVKLGVVSVGSSFKGILVEVEYLPCQVVQSCWSLMVEFMQGFLGSKVTHQVTPYLKSKFNDKYTPVDTIHQYLLFRRYLVNAPGHGVNQDSELFTQSV